MGLKLITPPAVEPITLAEARLHVRAYAGTDEDDMITALIVAARQYVENFTGRALITQTWDLALDAFPELVHVPKAPLASISSVKYIDSAGAEQTLGSSLYKVDTVSEPGRIAPAHGEVWPSARTEPNAITVRFVAGYGATAATVPQAIRNAMLLMIGHLYDNRMAVQADAQFYRLPLGVEALLGAYRMARWD